MYWGKIPVEKVAAYFYFTSQSGQARMVYGAKYHGFANIAIEVGEMLADEMKGFFDDIDCIVPMPISISRRMARGYNQSEMIARGISKATGIPIEKHAVIRRYFSRSQTHLTREERRENVSDVFVLKDADAVKGRHVLLIDDIITTGATTISCASEILKACFKSKGTGCASTDDNMKLGDGCWVIAVTTLHQHLTPITQHLKYFEYLIHLKSS